MEGAAVKSTLYIVSTPIGNLEDISLRALKVLSSVDYIACEDTRKTKILLDHYNISKPLLSYYSYNELQRIPEILSKLHNGYSIALVSDAGTPGISDPAVVLVRAARAENIPVIPVPGPSAMMAALIVSGFSLQQFVFEGFLPQKKGRKTKLQLLHEEPRTVVLYESPHRLLKTLRELFLVLGDRNVAVCRELTKKFEEVVRGSLGTVLEELSQKPVRGEYVLVIEGKKTRAEL